jgi:FAD:protein FMN transferase
MRRTSILFFLLFLTLAATTPLAEPDFDLRRHVEASRMSMACLYAIDAYAATDEQTLRRAVDAAFDEVDRIDRLMSHYKPESPLSRLNRDAGQQPVSVDPELFAFIKQSLRYSDESDGAFDITVGPLMKAWGFFRGEGHLPSSSELSTAHQRVGARHVTLNENDHTIRFDADGVELDLGGIAKGYAVDRAVGILRARHVDAALVSAGGSTIYGLGAPPGRHGWSVDIQDPTDARMVARAVMLRNRSLSVAGSSEKSFEADGIRYSHIMDPRTGRPVQGVLSVAVLTDTGTRGDALDDALFVLGSEKSRELLKRYQDVEAMFFLPDATHGWSMIAEGPHR